MDEWADEVPDNFRFYFQGENKPALTSQIKQLLGERFAGFTDSNIALIEYKSRTLREWTLWLQAINVDAVFLMDEGLQAKQLTDFKSLLEILGK